MTMFTRDEEFNEIIDNVVVGYYQGKCIVKDENDNLFFIECEGEYLPVGTTLFNHTLQPISDLNVDEQDELLSFFQ